VASHQVSVACNALPTQILTDHGAFSQLREQGKNGFIVMTYCDNVNVAANTEERANEINGVIMRHLENKGFALHDIEQASLSSKTLGKWVDGARGLVYASPEKRERLRHVLEWLERRPKISSRQMQIVLGHVVDVFLLRPELLSILCAVYRFAAVVADYPRRVTRGVARECKIIRQLLPLAYATIVENISSEVHMYDACQSGLAAVYCDCEMDRVREAMMVNERSRYKFSPVSVRPRDILDLDPLVDVESVLPLQKPDFGSYAVLPVTNFKELGVGIIGKDKDWRVGPMCKVKYEEPQVILEGRALSLAVLHASRNLRNHGKDLLMVGDNLSVVLAATKGRSSSFPLLCVLRRVCSVVLATNCRLHHRWCPSECNIADAPSRAWSSQPAETPQISEHRGQGCGSPEVGSYQAASGCFGKGGEEEAICRAHARAGSKTAEDIRAIHFDKGKEYDRAGGGLSVLGNADRLPQENEEAGAILQRVPAGVKKLLGRSYPH